MPSVTPLLTRGHWRSHAISDSTTLWVMGDPACDAQLSRSLTQRLAITDSMLASLETVTGHFAAILISPSATILIQDSMRSFPVFYSVAEGHLIVSDDVSQVAGNSTSYAADVESRLEFRHTAYVTGSKTLYKDVHQVQAGEVVSVDPLGNTDQRFYRQFRYSPQQIESKETVDAHFTAALDATMSRFLAHANGRQLVVPLSGGLDSRLLSVYLKDAGYENVVNFTYGSGRMKEVQISEQVASALGQKWLFCPYEEESIRTAWSSPETADFIKYVHAGASLPHVQDWYAVRWLKAEGLIDDDAIFLPGHTVVGNVHNQEILEADTFSRAEIKDVLLRRHYNLQPDNSEASQNFRVQQTLDGFLDQIEYDGSVLARLTAMQYWGLRERKAKYIGNSVRNYEFFGYDWAMPMLDREMYLAWGDFHSNITQNRDWYEGYVNERYTATSEQTLQTFTPTNVSKSNRDRIKKILRATGLLKLAERKMAAKAIQTHPMGFQWFVTSMTPKQFIKYVRRGGTLLGAYADEFLDDSWNQHCHLFED